MFYDQSDYEIRCEWGEQGQTALLSGCDAIVLVDILSFTTCVDVAVGRGAIVYAYLYRDSSAADYAAKVGALLAGRRTDLGARYSLSPDSLRTISPGTRLVLPSPNGAALSCIAGEAPTFAACLRNASAVARAAHRTGRKVGVVPAGERWRDGSLRLALEDAVGAGAVIHELGGAKSPEAEAAEALFLWFREDLAGCLTRCSSGRQLVELAYPQDVQTASQLNVSECVPALRDGAYVDYGGRANGLGDRREESRDASSNNGDAGFGHGAGGVPV